MDIKILANQIGKEVSDLPYYVSVEHDVIVLHRTEIVIGSLPLQHREVKRWQIASLQEWEQLREVLMPLDDLMEAHEIYASDPQFFERELENIKFQMRCRGISK